MQMLGGVGCVPKPCLPGAQGQVCRSVLACTQEYLCVSVLPIGVSMSICPRARGASGQAAHSKWLLGVPVSVRSGSVCVPDLHFSSACVCLWLSGYVSPGFRSLLGTGLLPKLPPSSVCSSWIRGCSELGPGAMAGVAGPAASPALATPGAGCIRRQVAPTA